MLNEKPEALVNILAILRNAGPPFPLENFTHKLGTLLIGFAHPNAGHVVSNGPLGSPRECFIAPKQGPQPSPELITDTHPHHLRRPPISRRRHLTQLNLKLGLIAR